MWEGIERITASDRKFKSCGSRFIERALKSGLVPQVTLSPVNARRNVSGCDAVDLLHHPATSPRRSASSNSANNPTKRFISLLKTFREFAIGVADIDGQLPKTPREFLIEVVDIFGYLAGL